MEEFEAYVVARIGALMRTAYLLTGDRQLAEDLVQESLAAVASRWKALSRKGTVDAYLRRAMYNRAIDGWRRRAKRPETLSADPSELSGQATGDDAEAVVRRQVLGDALLRLTPKQRAVLVLRYYDDRTEVESAAILGCSVNTVKSQTRHALDRLRILTPDLAATFLNEAETS